MGVGIHQPNLMKRCLQNCTRAQESQGILAGGQRTIIGDRVRTAYYLRTCMVNPLPTKFINVSAQLERIRYGWWHPWVRRDTLGMDLKQGALMRQSGTGPVGPSIGNGVAPHESTLGAFLEAPGSFLGCLSCPASIIVNTHLCPEVYRG